MSKDENQELLNSFSSLVSGLYGNNQATQLSKTDTFRIVNRYELLFYDRQLLSQLYVEHGLVQTLVEQPVQDALRGGIDITSGQLSEDDISELTKYIDKENILKKVAQTAVWGRLFGGGGLVINADQNPEKPFKIENLDEDSPLDFYPADLWELNLKHYTDNPTIEMDEDFPYNYYGVRLHKSRVIKFKGKEAPSFVRPRLRGWGMTEVERLVRSLNQYFKNNDVIFELLDEAKVDVYKIKGLNSALMSGRGTEKIQDRVQMGNAIKNFLNALVMDIDDNYDQKNMNFSGLGDMLTQIRQGIASDMKMPLTKLFGVSSAGFNSGEDDIENYNSMIETEVRDKIKYMVHYVLEMVCQKLFGFVPDDLEFEFKPLRILSSEQEENVKNQQFSRLIQAFSAGVISPEETKQAINAENLLPIVIEENDEIFEGNPSFNGGADDSSESSETPRSV